MKRVFFFLLLTICCPIFLAAVAFAKERETATCVVYFTGIGCPHCAKADPVVLEESLEKYPNLVVIEYEIYQERENAPLLYKYNEVYKSGLGIPLLIFDKRTYLIGDRPILQSVEKTLEEKEGNPCPLIDGSSAPFGELDLSRLPGKPKIWTKEAPGLPPENFQKSRPQEPLELTLPKVLSLAAADAVNPCALAVLTLMLIAVLAYNPQKRRNILLAGFAFAASVFIMYLFYGLVIIKIFQVVRALTSIRPWLYKILGVGAVVLGGLNIKDFFAYKPGGLGTEMPMKLRPRVQKIVSSVTSPRGAFGVGAFVTVFLLPCTIGPCVICGGILCSLSLLKALPWLLLYNLVFIFPMLVITILCYVGFATVEDVSGWKEKNIRYLHLVAGLIILGLGMAMLLGWV